MLRFIDPAEPAVALARTVDRVLPSLCTRRSALGTMYISGLKFRA